jgi:hypothetical protein
MAPLYMGSSSAFGGAFGGPGNTQSGPIGPVAGNPTKPIGTPIPRNPANPVGPVAGGGGSQLQNPPPVAPTGHPITAGTVTPSGVSGVSSAAPGPNVLGARSVTASGPSQGYDPSYLQNLATSIGALFTGGNQQGNNTSFNPLGNLSEISPTSSMGGNAPQQGLPQSWLQQALNGLGFSFGTPQAASSIAPVAPTVGGTTSNPIVPRAPSLT